MAMKINLGRLLDLLNGNVIDDLIVVDCDSWDNKIKLEYITNERDKKYTITIKEEQLEKLVKDNDND